MNEVLREFIGLGQMTKEYQEHGGAVNTGSSLKVQYAYTEMASSANHSRLTSITYPNGKVLTYNYSSGLNSNISRLSSLSETGRAYECDAWNRLIRIKSSGGLTLANMGRSWLSGKTKRDASIDENKCVPFEQDGGDLRSRRGEETRAEHEEMGPTYGV